MSHDETQQRLRTNLYVPDGVNAVKQRASAQEAAERGVHATLHLHPMGEGCGQECETFEPEAVSA